jgi:hypothetical protein
MKYFVCHRYRNTLTEKYIQEFYNNKKYNKLHDSPISAYKEMRTNFYDDSDYDVCEVENGKAFKIDYDKLIRIFNEKNEKM